MEEILEGREEECRKDCSLEKEKRLSMYGRNKPQLYSKIGKKKNIRITINTYLKYTNTTLHNSNNNNKISWKKFKY